MRIGLNLLHTMPEIGSGGWNYIQNLVAALGEYDGGHEYVAFVTKASVCLVPHSTSFEPVVIDLIPCRAYIVSYMRTPSCNFWHPNFA